MEKHTSIYTINLFRGAPLQKFICQFLGRNKEKLLQHKIPKKYLILKDIVQELAEERIHEEKDPVLDKSSYM